jgi:hypothetical protein
MAQQFRSASASWRCSLTLKTRRKEISLESLLAFPPPLEDLELLHWKCYWPEDVDSLRLLSHRVKRLQVTSTKRCGCCGPKDDYWADNSPSLQYAPKRPEWIGRERQEAEEDDG